MELTLPNIFKSICYADDKLIEEIKETIYSNMDLSELDIPNHILLEHVFYFQNCKFLVIVDLNMCSVIVKNYETGLIEEFRVPEEIEDYYIVEKVMHDYIYLACQFLKEM